MNGDVIGFVACDTNWVSPVEEDAGEIHELFVKPEFQRRGIGKALLKISLNYIKSKRKKYAGLWVGISNNN
jgi:ribosomal protein S18 acetylase RimI-like enzyme